MKHFRTYRFASRAFGHVVMAALMLATVSSLARAETPSPLPDKPFAEHRIVLQLSDNDPRKQSLVITVAYNLLKIYDPHQIAIEIVAFGPGIDLLRTDNP